MKKTHKKPPTKPAPKKKAKRRVRPAVDFRDQASPLRQLLEEALAPSTARTRSGGGGKWKAAFLRALAASSNVTLACRAAGVDRRTAYDHKSKDKAFADQWEQALDVAVELMEAEMHRRAFAGTERPVYQGGFLAGTVREFSDTLAIFLAKAHRPEKYRERVSVKNETPRAPLDPTAAGAAVLAFLGEMQSGAPADGSGGGGEAAGPDEPA